MKCDFNLCVYNKDMACLLGDISINELGMCDSCMIPQIPNDYLNLLKRAVLTSKELASLLNNNNDE